jgi:hypothetical protein
LISFDAFEANSKESEVSFSDIFANRSLQGEGELIFK